MATAHEIDYRIVGEEMQYVEIELDPNETAIAEAGSFMLMDEGIQMETIFGDGSANQGTGVLGKLFSAGKRLLTGESLFMTAYTNVGQGKKMVSFASPYPGKIIPLDLMRLGGPIVCQKDAFLCAAKGVSVGIALQRKLGTGLFGGERFSKDSQRIAAYGTIDELNSFIGYAITETVAKSVKDARIIRRFNTIHVVFKESRSGSSSNRAKCVF